MDNKVDMMTSGLNREACMREPGEDTKCFTGSEFTQERREVEWTSGWRRRRKMHVASGYG